ncbi:MAG: hypothetical protein IPK67_03500 [Planctomycetes bacterium]|nr:hypothetical protein [Planctomycetota bacterium]
MKPLLMPLLVAVTTISSSIASAQSYELQVFDPGNVAGVEFGFYSGLSDRSPLVSAFDVNFEPIGVFWQGNQARVFRVGAPEEYCWYRGINDQLSTVGFREVQGTSDVAAWTRNKHGYLRTFATPGERVFLYRLNKSNVAVGETTTGGGVAWSAFLVDEQGGRPVAVPGVSPALNTYFAAINDKGQILGGAWNQFEHHPFLMKGNTVTYFDIGDAHEIGLRALNNKGQAAGYWTEYEPLIGDYRSHGFIRKANGSIKTIDLTYGFARHEVYDPDLYGGYPILEAHGELLTQATAILDLNDRGEIVAEVTGWYRITLFIDGVGEVQFTEPRWVYALGTPAG